MSCTVFGRSFIIMPRLNAIDSLAELGLTDSIAVCCGFTVGLINRHLLVIDPCGVGGGCGALHFCRILVGVIRDSEIEECSVGHLIVRIHLDGAGVIESGRIGSIDIGYKRFIIISTRMNEYQSGSRSAECSGVPDVVEKG